MNLLVQHEKTNWDNIYLKYLKSISPPNATTAALDKGTIAVSVQY